MIEFEEGEDVGIGNTMRKWDDLSGKRLLKTEHWQPSFVSEISDADGAGSDDVERRDARDLTIFVLAFCRWVVNSRVCRTNLRLSVGEFARCEIKENVLRRGRVRVLIM